MRLSVEAKLGCRAAIAVLITLVICHGFDLKHAYWAVLTSLALITPSWGESLQKAYTRFGMTIAGCMLTYALYLVLGHSQWLILSCLLLGIFGMAYFFAVSYAWAMFFIGMIVVSMFMYMQLWNMELLWQRIYETAIGCLVAAVVTGLFMPIYARQTFSQDLPKVWLNFIKHLQVITALAAKHEALSALEGAKSLNALFLQIKNLSKQYDAAKYEMMIMMKNAETMTKFMHKFEIGFHYLTSLTGSVRLLVKDPISHDFETEINQLLKHLENMTQVVLALLENKPITLIEQWENSPAREVARAKFIQAKCQRLFSADEMTHVTAMIYYGRMLDKTLYEMAHLLAAEPNNNRRNP